MCDCIFFLIVMVYIYVYVVCAHHGSVLLRFHGLRSKAFTWQMSMEKCTPRHCDDRCLLYYSLHNSFVFWSDRVVVRMHLKNGYRTKITFDFLVVQTFRQQKMYALAGSVHTRLPVVLHVASSNGRRRQYGRLQRVDNDLFVELFRKLRCHFFLTVSRPMKNPTSVCRLHTERLPCTNQNTHAQWS